MQSFRFLLVVYFYSFCSTFANNASPIEESLYYHLKLPISFSSNLFESITELPRAKIPPIIVPHVAPYFTMTLLEIVPTVSFFGPWLNFRRRTTIALKIGSYRITTKCAMFRIERDGDSFKEKFFSYFAPPNDGSKISMWSSRIKGQALQAFEEWAHLNTSTAVHDKLKPPYKGREGRLVHFRIPFAAVNINTFADGISFQEVQFDLNITVALIELPSLSPRQEQQRLLDVAIIDNNFTNVGQSLSSGARADGFTLLTALQNQNVNILKSLLDFSEPASLSYLNGQILIEAVVMHQYLWVEWLIKFGANPNDCFCEALFHASRQLDSRMVNEILRSSHPIDWIKLTEQTLVAQELSSLLQFLVINKATTILEMFFKNKLDPDINGSVIFKTLIDIYSPRDSLERSSKQDPFLSMLYELFPVETHFWIELKQGISVRPQFDSPKDERLMAYRIRQKLTSDTNLSPWVEHEIEFMMRDSDTSRSYIWKQVQQSLWNPPFRLQIVLKRALALSSACDWNIVDEILRLLQFTLDNHLCLHGVIIADTLTIEESLMKKLDHEKRFYLAFMDHKCSIFKFAQGFKLFKAFYISFMENWLMFNSWFKPSSTTYTLLEIENMISDSALRDLDNLKYFEKLLFKSNIFMQYVIQHCNFLYRIAIAKDAVNYAAILEKFCPVQVSSFYVNCVQKAIQLDQADMCKHCVLKSVDLDSSFENGRVLRTILTPMIVKRPIEMLKFILLSESASNLQVLFGPHSDEPIKLNYQDVFRHALENRNKVVEKILLSPNVLLTVEGHDIVHFVHHNRLMITNGSIMIPNFCWNNELWKVFLIEVSKYHVEWPKVDMRRFNHFFRQQNVWPLYTAAVVNNNYSFMKMIESNGVVPNESVSDLIRHVIWKDPTPRPKDIRILHVQTNGLTETDKAGILNILFKYTNMMDLPRVDFLNDIELLTKTNQPNVVNVLLKNKQKICTLTAKDTQLMGSVLLYEALRMDEGLTSKGPSHMISVLLENGSNPLDNDGSLLLFAIENDGWYGFKGFEVMVNYLIERDLKHELFHNLLISRATVLVETIRQRKLPHFIMALLMALPLEKGYAAVGSDSDQRKNIDLIKLAIRFDDHEIGLQKEDRFDLKVEMVDILLIANAKVSDKLFDSIYQMRDVLSPLAVYNLFTQKGLNNDLQKYLNDKNIDRSMITQKCETFLHERLQKQKRKLYKESFLK